MTLLSLSLFILSLWLFVSLYWYFGMRRVQVLSPETPVPEPATFPRLSVIIPALNEADTIETSLLSVLAQDYPALEIIAINDRSTDATGAILERLKSQHPHLQVLHIETLPPGWLGKNHALYKGAEAATGDYLLFTDADITYAPGAFRKTVAYTLEHNRDHLVALPRFIAKGWLLESFITVFALLFTLYAQPWRAVNPKAKEAIGVGAFALVRREAYWAAGSHKAIALRPDDDMKLGTILKGAGFAQEAVFATELLEVEWYPSLKTAIRGLNKNAFAGFNYSLFLAFGAVIVLFISNVLPFILVFVTRGLTQGLNLGVLVIVALCYSVHTRKGGTSLFYVLLHPVGVSLMAYAVLEATFKTLYRGGIEWRGTYYRLEELRKNRV